ATDITANANSIATNTTNITANATAISDHIAADGDLDGQNEIQDLELSGNELKITNNPSATPIDLSGYISSDDQNLESATLGTDNILSLGIEDGTGATVDLSPLDESAEVTALDGRVTANANGIADNATDITANANSIATNTTNITANATAISDHIAADGDLDGQNEIQDLELSGNELKITNNPSATPIDLSGYISSDDQNL
ncbi:hypothetical protein, partial [Galbibacter pacificus]